MKKTMAAVAVLGAFAGSAIAADVTLYGVLDMGLAYNHVDLDQSGVKNKNTFSMNSGQQSGSRWGLKGVEDLGNGLKVGFILEDGFKADTGAQGDQMFDRESSLFIEGGFGKLALGRMGAINQGSSSWALANHLSAFTTSFGPFAAQAGNFISTAGKWDNMISYRTPTFAGFTVYTQYSMGKTTSGGKAIAGAVENESSADRYYAIGATYANGPFLGYLAVDSTNYKSWYKDAGAAAASAHKTDDSLTVTLGGNYDFDVAKVYFGAQYFDEVTLSSIGGIVGTIKYDESTDSTSLKVKGYGLGLSTSVPLAGGSALLGVAYVDAKEADSVSVTDFDFRRWSISAGYDYPFSKRTNAYAVASYMNDKPKEKGEASWNPTVCSFQVGLRHKF